MRKRLFCLLVTLLLILSCNTPKIGYYYFYEESNKPQSVVDSLLSSYSLIIPPIEQWNRREFLSNERKILPIYYIYGNRNDSVFVFSIIDRNEESSIIKMRIEYKDKK